MARLTRFFLPDQALHVIQRGNNREQIFTSDEDYRYYLHCLKTASDMYGLAVHAYVLMSNHVHLLVTPKTDMSLPRTMQSIGRRYVQHFNQHYHRTGTLWEGRYKSCLIDNERYLLTCMRYIETNPVRAAMVKSPGDYPWSSYRSNAEGKMDILLTLHPLYRALGQSGIERQAFYRELFRQTIPDVELDTIRRATNRSWVMGDDHFSAAIASLTKRRTSPLPRGRPRKLEINRL